jgi:hypothetical protein
VMRRGVFRALWRRESWLVHIFILIYYMGPCTRSTLLTSLLILNVCIKDLLHVLYLESNVAENVDRANARHGLPSYPLVCKSDREGGSCLR